MTRYERKKFVKSILNKIDDKVLLSDEDLTILINGDFEVDSEILEDTRDGFVTREVILKLGERYFCIEYEEFAEYKTSKILSISQPTEVELTKVVEIVTKYIPVAKERHKFCFRWKIGSDVGYYLRLKNLILEKGDELIGSYITPHRCLPVAATLALSVEELLQLIEKYFDSKHIKGIPGFYDGDFPKETISRFQGYLGSLAAKYEEHNWKAGKPIKTWIRISKGDVDYLNATGELSPKLEDWLSTIS